jgi:hypothetical protein
VDPEALAVLGLDHNELAREGSIVIIRMLGKLWLVALMDKSYSHLNYFLRLFSLLPLRYVVSPVV